MSALQRLRQLADDFAVSRQATLESFNEFIRLNREYGVIIADESVFATAEQVVNLMTVHKAKGLEFDTVFIIDMIDAEWRPRRQRRKPPVNLEALQEYSEDPDDYARLLYVAASRAKSDLIFASYQTNEEGKDTLPTPLIHHVPTRAIGPDEFDPVEVLERNLAWPDLNQPDAKLALSSVLETYELPVTSLINFLDVIKGGPQYFLTRNLLRLPEIKKPRLAFGTAIHEALRHAQLLVNTGKLKLESVLEAFSRTLRNEQLSPEEHERYLVHGEQLLKHLFTWQAFELPKGSLPERKIQHVKVGEALIEGELDRLDTSKDQLHIVDYKTGNPLGAELTATTKTEGVKAWKHRTQLVFYALL